VPDNPFFDDATGDVSLDAISDGAGDSWERPYPEFEPQSCSPLFNQDELVIYEIEIEPHVWLALQDRWLNWSTYYDQGQDPKDWHPLLEFRYKTQTIHDASIRLKGNVQNWHSSPDKMQFTFSFREEDSNGRFMGLRKVHLDAPHNDPTMIRERLAASFLAEFQVPTPCVNSAALYVNGEYYGLFSNVEFVDKEFLKRNFGQYSNGNLYKYDEKKTNESSPDTSDLDAFMSEMTSDEAEELLDVEMLLRFLAGEAIMPQNDGYFVGGTNFYVYHHPAWGMVMIPWDMDYSFETAPVDADPVSYEVPWGLGKWPAFRAVMADPVHVSRYKMLLAEGVDLYGVDSLRRRIDGFVEQTAAYVEEDQNKPFSTVDHLIQLELLRIYVDDRREFLVQWLRDEGIEIGHQELVSGGWSILFGYARMTWQAAQDDCVRKGGELFVPGNQGEQDEIAAHAMGLVKDNWWIGANRHLVPGTWTDATGSVLNFTAWGPDQPNGTEEQQCVVLDTGMGGLWNDKECDGYSLPYICRRPVPTKQ